MKLYAKTSSGKMHIFNLVYRYQIRTALALVGEPVIGYSIHDRGSVEDVILN
jgi:hypothetical protein